MNQPKVVERGAQSATNAKLCEAFVNRLRKNNPQVYREFARKVISNRKSASPELLYNDFKELFSSHTQLIIELNKLLASEARVSIPENEEDQESTIDEQKLTQIFETIKKRNKNKMKDFLQLIQKFGTSRDVEKLLQDCKDLFFAEEPDIYKTISKMLSGQIKKNSALWSQQIPISHSQQQQQQLTNQSHLQLQSNQDYTNEESAHSTSPLIPPSKQQQNQLLAPSNQSANQQNIISGDDTVSTPSHQIQQKANQVGKKHSKQQQQQQAAAQKPNSIAKQANENIPAGNPYIPIRPAFTLPSGSDKFGQHTRSELAFFAMIEMNMGKKCFVNVCKIFHLYTECIISASECYNLLENVFDEHKSKETYKIMMKELIECREESRRKSANCPFKPLSEIEFSNEQRQTFSYVTMPKNYPSYCSNSNEISINVLNTSIVSVPHGSEHQSFIVMRKNQYEEQLFKNEDEKYENDLQLQQIKRVLTIFRTKQEALKDPKLKKKYLNEVFDYKGFTSLFRTDYQKIQENLETDFDTHFPQLKAKVEDKYQEMINHRLTVSRKSYHEVSEKNFHRSLDHRSFYFKRNDRKFTTAPRFDKELEYRYKLVNQLLDNNYDNKEEYETTPDSFFEICNTYQNLTNSEKCDHSNGESQYILNTVDWKKCEDKTKLPLITYFFGDQEALKDAFSFLIAYSYYYGSNNVEKEKIRTLAMTVIKGILDLEHRSLEIDETLVYENPIILGVAQIENQIYNKIYSYMSQQMYTQLKEQIRQEEEYLKEHPNLERQESMLSRGNKIVQRNFDDDDKVLDSEMELESCSKLDTSRMEKQKKSAIQQSNDEDDDNDNEEEDDDEDEEETSSPEKKRSTNNILGYENGQKKTNKEKENGNGKGKSSVSKKKENNNDLKNNKNNNNNNNSTKKNQENGNMEVEESDEKLNGNNKNNKNDNDNATTPNNNNNNSFDQEEAGEEDEDTISLSSENEIDRVKKTLKQMNYSNEHISELKYLPKQDDDYFIFYGTRQLQVILRLFYTVYERILKAREASHNFEKNEKTDKLSQEQKNVLAKERYQLFKLVLFTSFRTRDSTKTEDFLRSLFGNQAYLLFTIDKALAFLCKSLSQFTSDELSKNIMEIFISPEGKQQPIEKDEINFTKISKLTYELVNQPSERNMYRFSLHKNTGLLYVNYIETAYKNWEKKLLSQISSQYSNYIIFNNFYEDSNCHHNGPQYVFLKRNKEKNQRKIEQKQCVQINNIVYYTHPNTSKLMTTSEGKEDVFISNNKLKRKLNHKQRILVELKKINKFNKWLKQELNHLK